jgi:hypothetical protein
VDFGAVQPGSAATRHFVVSNFTGVVLPVPGVGVQGDGFALAGFPPSGSPLQPAATAAFDVVFQPAAPGNFTASLSVGDRAFTLTGAAVAAPPPLPQPQLAILLGQAASGQQGTVAVQFGAPALTAGSGTLTLDFQPATKGAADSAIQLGTAGRSLPFTFATGDTQGSFSGLAAVNFQTGTTAGTLTFTATVGATSATQAIAIVPAPVGIVSATGTRGANSLELKIAGYDNTRTAGLVTYTFFDAGGNAIAPGAIAVDSSGSFAAYFAASNAGGTFLLDAIFPVTGDTSRIAAFEVQIGNAAGTARSGRQNF